MAKSKTTTKSKAKAGTMTKGVTGVREMIIDARNQIDDNYLKMSELLHKVYSERLFEEWGFEEFKDYCIDELDFQYRKGMYLVEIWAAVLKHKLDHDQVAKIGWTKMKEVCVLVAARPRAKAGILKRALKQTVAELKAEVNAQREEDGSGRSSKGSGVLKIPMNTDEGKVIYDALSEAKKLVGADNNTAALEMICQDWLMEKGSVPEQTSLDDMIALIKRLYDVDVAPVDGEDTAEKPAKSTKAKATKGKATKAKTTKAKTTKAKPKGKAAAKKEEVEDDASGDSDADIDDLLGL